MDDDWPLLMKGDCLLSAVACGSTSQELCWNTKDELDSTNYLSLSSGPQHNLSSLDSNDFSFNLSDSLCNTQRILNLPFDHFSPPYANAIKLEPRDDSSNSEYTATFSQSQSCSPCSSSLSSPDQDGRETAFEKNYAEPGNEVYAVQMSAEESFSPPADVTVTSSTGRSRQHLELLPPVSHFSYSSHQRSSNHSSTKTLSERLETPSPPSSDCSSSLEPPSQLGPCKARSKMHEMAVRQRLITDQDPRGSGFVQLSAEEKRTLLQEGYGLPTRLPLTKSEEDALKIVRRKIKNKLSAQESRRKRKEYMDTLEQRVQLYFSENSSLKAKIKHLEQNNRSLIVQLKKMQSAVNAHNSNHHPPPCLSAQLSPTEAAQHK